MGTLEQNTTLIYGIHIRESANDGSDFSNGATDYRVVFLGEDGALHAKDSAGTVTSLSGAAAHSALTGLTSDDHTQYLKETDVAAKGDIYAASANDTVGVLSVGSNNQVLTADSAQSLGVKWATVSAGTPAFHGVRARTSGDTALTSGSVVYVGFDAADEYDTDAYHNPASNNTRLTVPSGLDGYYRISAGSLTTGSPGTSYSVIRKNGTTLMANGSAGSDANAGSFTANCTLSLVATDYVEFGIKVGAASKNATDAGVVEGFFEMHLVGT